MISARSRALLVYLVAACEACNRGRSVPSATLRDAATAATSSADVRLGQPLAAASASLPPPVATASALSDPSCEPPASRPVQFKLLGRGPLPAGPQHAVAGRRIVNLDVGAGTSFVWAVQTPRAVLVGVRMRGYCREAAPSANVLQIELPASNKPVELVDCPTTPCTPQGIRRR